MSTLGSCKCDCLDTQDRRFFAAHARPQRHGRQNFFEKKEDTIFFKDPLYRPRRSSSETNFKNMPFTDYFDPMQRAALSYTCYLNESDGEEGELLKVRPMRLTYYLADDSMSLIEPFTENSGHLQGRMFGRQQVPRSSNDRRVGSDFVTWRDIIVGQDIVLFGRTYRVVDCDDFTKGYLADRGLKVTRVEPIPIDSWNLTRHFQTDKARQVQLKKEGTQEQDPALMNSWKNLPESLSFFCAWLDSSNDFEGTRVKRTFKLTINAMDDSVVMVETTPGYGNQLFLKTDRLPYQTADGLRRHYRVDSMRPGMWIDVYKRPMYIYDCENQPTVDFVRQQFGEFTFAECSMDLLKAGPPSSQLEILPNELWFRARIAEYPLFNLVLIYNVNTRRIDVYEEGKRRPWTKGRPFLLEMDAGPLCEKDFDVGAKIQLFKWNFHLYDADRPTQAFVKAYSESVVSDEEE